MFENVKWLFFDVGSTLVNEEKAYEHRMREMSEAAQMPYEKIYEMAVGFYKENKKGDLEAARALGLSKPKWHKEDEFLYEGARECLEALSGKYKIGVIANQSLGTAERLERLGIRQFIDVVIASAEEGVAKPDRRIFEIALERGGCKPSEAVMIGDRVDNDIVPAKLLGMHTIWIRQGFGKYWRISSETEKAEAVVDSLEECCMLLSGRGGL